MYPSFNEVHDEWTEEKNKFYDNPTNEQLDMMYKFASDAVLALSKNKRSESFSWKTHYKNIEVIKKKNNTNDTKSPYHHFSILL